MTSCKSIEARAARDYDRLQNAWKKLKQAQTRMSSVRNFGRGAKYTSALKKARVAVDQADGEVRAASGRIQNAFAAVNKCHRRKAGS